MYPKRHILLWICLSTALWAFGFGVQSQVVSHWLKEAGASNTVIGWNHAGYYLGLALASLVVPIFVRVWGGTCAAAGMFFAGSCQLLFPLGNTFTVWLLLRFLGGVGGAFSVIPIETIISQEAPAGKRGLFFACYGLALTLGGALGIWTGLSLFETGSLVPFFLSGLAPMLGGVILLRTVWTIVPSPSKYQGRLPWGEKVFSLGTAWYQGFLEGGMLAFLSLFLLSAGFSQEEAGLLMGATLLGVIAFQVPVAWMADRWGRRSILLICYAVVLGGLALVPWRSGPVELAGLLFLVGACSGAMYPLGLAILGEGLPQEQMPRAYAWYLALECFGSQIGAAAMGLARDAWGDGAMFGVGVAAGLAVLGLALLRPPGRRVAVELTGEWSGGKQLVGAGARRPEVGG